VGPWESRESRGLCIEGVILVTFSHFGRDGGTGIRIRGGMGGSLGKSQISETLHRGGHFGNFLSFRVGWGDLAYAFGAAWVGRGDWHKQRRLAFGSAMNE
jgi:hypothetical protein